MRDTGSHLDMNPHARKPWAFFIIIVVVILFGAFWYVESKRAQAPTQAILPAPDQKLSDALKVSNLQASVINSSIPDYSQDF